uniref:Proteasome subunit alpha type-5 n=1 Tax=Lygus hesperus TaxID=30085 RepID=A0A0A9XK57_LYGHE
MVPSSLRKIEQIDKRIYCAMSGVIPDARTLIDYARVTSQNHWFTYNEPITVQVIADSIAEKCAGFGEGNMARPYGVSLLVGGIDKYGTHLYCINPSGVATVFYAKAIGTGSEVAMNILKEQYSKDMSLDSAKGLALDVLKQVIEEKITEHNVELLTISSELAGWE